MKQTKRDFTELETIAARSILRKLFREDRFFLCDGDLCSTLHCNGYPVKHEGMNLYSVSILENGVLIANFDTPESEETAEYIIRHDNGNRPQLIKATL